MKYRNYTIKVRPATGQIKADVYRGRSYITSLFGPTRERAVERAELFVDGLIDNPPDEEE